MKRIYTADTYTNVLPSAHVFGAMAIDFAVTDCKSLRKPKWLLAAAIVLGVLICVSTVFVKQHSILDIFAAIPLGFIWWAIIYKVIFREKKQTE